MPPNSERPESIHDEEELELVAPQAAPRKYELVYFNVIAGLYWHVAAVYGLYLCFGARWQTLVFSFITYFLSVLGITGGAHRLWSHRSYKVSRPLEVFLLICQTMAMQNSVMSWVRDHRLHHKYADTDGDPHNSTRGLFYSHFGWMAVRKHPEVTKRGKTTEMSDIYDNPLLQFQKKYIGPLNILIGLALPTLIPMLCWDETFSNAWHLCHLRLVTSLNAILLINSLNHAHGHKPYDKSIAATNYNATSLILMGENFHNYHHVFPNDYRTSELGNTFSNLTTMFIDFCARRGWAWDLKSVSDSVVEKRMVRTGDGTNLWGEDGRGQEVEESR